jgi:hypothetical protein
MSKVLRILVVRRVGFTLALAQMLGEIDAREGAVETSSRFCYVRRDNKIGRFVQR